MEFNSKTAALCCIALLCSSILTGQEVRETDRSEGVNSVQRQTPALPETNPTEDSNPSPGDSPNAQDKEVVKYKIGFTTPHYEITRVYDQEKFEYIPISYDIDTSINYKLSVSIDDEKTTMLASSFSIVLPDPNTNDKLRKNLLLIIDPDSLPDRPRTIVLTLEASVEEDDRGKTHVNTAPYNSVEIKIESEAALTDYSYLAYVGTNFDLVDGIQANKLFFATNLFIPPANHNWYATGLYVSLYGNRSFSSTDSTIGLSRNRRYTSIGDSLYRVHQETVDRIGVYYSDNIGAQVSWLTNFVGLGQNRHIQFWIAPTTEFIWRRSVSKVQYSNVRDTSSIMTPDKPTSINDVTVTTTYSNRFEFNYGLGFFLNHSNDKISVRFTVSVGGCSIFNQGTNQQLANNTEFDRLYTDWYYMGKIWITEPFTGLTLQAETYNRFAHPTPYYVVTLSKAIEFSSLTGLFQPLTKR